MLEIAKFPFCAAGAECTNGERYGGFASKEIVEDPVCALDWKLCGCYKRDGSVGESDMTDENGCKVELTIGESNPLPGPRQPSSSTSISPDDSSGQCSLLSPQVRASCVHVCVHVRVWREGGCSGDVVGLTTRPAGAGFSPCRVSAMIIWATRLPFSSGHIAVQTSDMLIPTLTGEACAQCGCWRHSSLGLTAFARATGSLQRLAI